MELTHDWSIEGEFDKNNSTGGSGGYLSAGIGWNRKHFSIPKSRSGKKIYIEFDGVYMNASVYINGYYLGCHNYGYTGFAHDLTAYIKFGNQENVIAVKVDNSEQPNSRWYTG